MISKFRYDVNFGKNVLINHNSIFEGKNYLGNNVEFTNSYMGFGSYIANNTIISSTYMGRYCAIGDNVRTFIGSHPINKYVSIHPAFYSKDNQSGFSFTKTNEYEGHVYLDSKKKYVVEIGNDVWIGNNVCIFDGIKIGDGAIIGLGSIVKKNIEPFSINVGIPSKRIGYRFEKKEIDFLMEYQWWNKSYSWIQKHSKLFKDSGQFIEKIKKDFE